MQRFVPEVVSIAEACLGGLRDRSALLIGPEELRHPYKLLLQQAGINLSTRKKRISICRYITTRAVTHESARSLRISAGDCAHYSVLYSAGCVDRRTPLLIFDLAESPQLKNGRLLPPSASIPR